MRDMVGVYWWRIFVEACRHVGRTRCVSFLVCFITFKSSLSYSSCAGYAIQRRFKRLTRRPENRTDGLRTPEELGRSKYEPE
ncbi:hypothetical protein V8C37DRAFT_382055 [Trichoderma ceciliae]